MLIQRFLREYSQLYSKNWKQLKYPPTNKWINQLWFIYKMQHYSEKMKQTIDSTDASQKGIKKHKEADKEEYILHLFIHVNFQKIKSMFNDRKQSADTWEWQTKQGVIKRRNHKGDFWAVMDMLIIFILRMVL